MDVKVLVGGVDCPEKLEPQHTAAPFVRIPQPCHPPALMDVNVPVVDPSMSQLSQHTAAPFVRIPQVRPLPALMDVNVSALVDVGVAGAACWALASFELDSRMSNRSATATSAVRE